MFQQEVSRGNRIGIKAGIPLFRLKSATHIHQRIRLYMCRTAPLRQSGAVWGVTRSVSECGLRTVFHRVSCSGDSCLQKSSDQFILYI